MSGAVVFALAFGALAVAGCQPQTAGLGVRLGPDYLAAFSCDADLRDVPCVACLKARCCAQAAACSASGCSCARRCIVPDNTMACAAKCSAAEDRAMAGCAADACASACPGGPR